jgi:hypothetical protein
MAYSCVRREANLQLPADRHIADGTLGRLFTGRTEQIQHPIKEIKAELWRGAEKLIRPLFEPSHQVMATR